ncbi:MAG: hypothetical protein KC425_26020 [Anaerolineales bacterium]|nr:hypothetical protein [Anaerolineales bacterium]
MEPHLWYALLLAAGLTLLILWPRLANPYSAEDDFRNWYWMHRFEDPALFANDARVNRDLLELNLGPVRIVTLKNSPLYGLMYQLLSSVAPFILVGKLLAVPLTLIAVFYLYRLCRRLIAPHSALVVTVVFVLLNLSLTSMVSTVGGFQRSFMLPLLLAFLHYLWMGRFWQTAVVLLVSVALYPPLFLLQMVTLGVDLLLLWWPNRRTAAGRRYLRWLGGLALAGVVVVLLLVPYLRPYLAQLANADLAANWQAIFGATQYGPDGRARMFLIFPFVGRGGIADHGITILVLLFLALFAVAIGLWQPARVRGFPRVFKALFWGSWVSFGLAWAAFLATASFVFYLPSRYTQSSLLLVLFVFVMVHGRDALTAAARRFAGQATLLPWLTVPLSGLLAAAFFLLPEAEAGAVAFGRGGTRWVLLAAAVAVLALTVLRLRRPGTAVAATHAPRTLSPGVRRAGAVLLLLVGVLITWSLQPFLTYYEATAAEQALYAYLQTLPKDVLLAGDPAVLDAVPLFGERMALFAQDRIHPDAQVIEDTLLAYYAETREALLAYCQAYGVDYMVVDQNQFLPQDPETRRYFYEPYHSAVAPLIEQQATFLMNTLPDTAKSFQQDNLFVVPCANE